MKKIVYLSAALVIAALALQRPASAQKHGGTLNFTAPYGRNLTGLNPYVTNRYQDFLVTMNIYRSLYRWDARKNEPVLDLAESVDISDDGLTYTFTLLPNIMFHNNRRLVADDIIWTYTYCAAMQPDSASFDQIQVIKGAMAVHEGDAAAISGLKKIDDLTFEVTLKNPVDLKYYLWAPWTAVLPEEEVQGKEAQFNSHPVGCGPFKFVKWEKGSQVVLEKFDHFYVENRPYLDRVVYRIMPDADERDRAFRANALDATIVSAADYPEYAADPKICENMIEVTEMFTRLVGMNPDFKPFADKRVRRAVCYALPAALIIKNTLKDKAVPCRGFLPDTSPAFNPNAMRYEYDLEKAKALMKAAGYEKGFTVNHAVGTANQSWGTGIYKAMIPFLKKINIDLKIEQMDSAAMARRIRKGNYQMFIWSLDSGPDPLVALQKWLSVNPAGSGNYVKYNNPEFDKLVGQAAKENDSQKRNALLMAADGILTRDAPMWFFNYNKAVMAFQPRVHNLSKVAPEMMFQDLTHVWVDKRSCLADFSF